MQRTAADWFVEGLKQRGVEWIATLCGHGLDPLFDSARRAGIRLIDVRNEQTAGYIAEAAGRLNKRPGVCASSSGVAVPNALTGVMNAWFDQAPMLYISGSANLTHLGAGCFQDCDQVAIAAPVTKYSRLISTPNRVEHMLDEAWNAAMTAPHGPVHLMFPMDVQRAAVEESDLFVAGPAPQSGGVDASQVGEVLAALASAKRPLLIAGSGVYYAGEGAALLRFAARNSIPVQTPIWDRGICDQTNEAFLGVIGSLTCDPGLLAMSDCVVLAGAAVDYRLQHLQHCGKVLRLDRGWELLADAELPAFSDWLAEARRVRTEFSAKVRATGERQRMAGRTHALDIIDALQQAMPDDATLIIDGGSIGQWAHHLLTERRYPGYWLTCGRSGVVGYGLGAAMAARLSRPGKPVVLLSGDGAFTFTVAELECAARQGLPFVILLADDQKWGITHSGHLRQFGCAMASELGPIAFDALARSLGAQGVRIEHSSEIAEVLERSVKSGVVTLVHLPISGGNPGV
ncbi:MAG: thiamine pyrophosphate-binding protein [Acidobacteria bacterium]|nr:thiamine pyrophosphate-binding protein [Acidobacteriota bacterium]